MHSSLAPSPSSPPLTQAHRVPVLRICVSLLAVLYWQTLVSFPLAWSEGQEQGFVVAILCGWLLWRDRALLTGDGRGMPAAAVLVAGWSMLWLVAWVLNARVVYQAVLPLLLLTWLLATAGTAAVRAALPVAGAFFFAIPVWSVFTRPLQSMTVAANQLLLRVAGIEATIDGDIIRIPEGVFLVAEGCAGVNYFEIGLLVSVIYALLFLRTWKARAIAVVAAAALTIVSNWLRVFGLIVIGHQTDMQSPLMKGHGTYGWIIFSVAMALFFAVLPWVDRLDRSSSTDPAKPIPTTAHPVSLLPVVLATAAALLGPLVLLLATTLRTTAPSTERPSGLHTSASWQPDASSLASWSPEYRGADEHRRQGWRDGEFTVQVDRFLYIDQTQGKELVNSENRMAPDSLVVATGVSGSLNEFERKANVSVVKTERGLRLVWYWFHVAGRDTHSSTDAKLLELVSFARGAPASELVAVSTDCRDVRCDGATRTLYRFVTGRTLRP